MWVFKDFYCTELNFECTDDNEIYIEDCNECAIMITGRCSSFQIKKCKSSTVKIGGAHQLNINDLTDCKFEISELLNKVKA